MLEKKRVLGCPTGLEPVTSGITIRLGAHAAPFNGAKSLKTETTDKPKADSFGQNRCKNRCAALPGFARLKKVDRPQTRGGFMRTALMFLALSVGLVAAPINGGSCNGGGTAAQIQALSLGCSEGLFSINGLILPPVVDLDTFTLEFFDIDVEGGRLNTVFRGVAGPGSIRLDVRYSGNPVGRVQPFWFGFNAAVPNPNDPLQFDIANVVGGGPYRVDGFVIYTGVEIVRLPEPSTYALCAAALATLVIKRQR
jgi:hypothetical protein